MPGPSSQPNAASQPTPPRLALVVHADPPRRVTRTPNGREIPLVARGLVYAPCTSYGGWVVVAVNAAGDYGSRIREIPADSTAEEQDRIEAELLAQLERDDPSQLRLVTDA